MTGRLGHPRVHYGVTTSTNERAKELALGGAPHGTIVTAGEQSAGRGRQGRTWSAPPGRALLLSVIVRGLGRGDELLPLAVPVAVAEAAEAVAEVRCAIKWPNDVWVGERKLAGILLEGRPQERWAVIGIGLNVGTGASEFPEELRGVATSLAAETGVDPGVEVVLEAVLARLGERLGGEGAAVLAEWRSRDALLGRQVRWNGGSGVAAGLDDAGALLVDTADGRVALDAGEVHLTKIE